MTVPTVQRYIKMQSVSLNYDEANIFSRWLVLWPIKVAKYFRSVKITPETLPEVPQSLEYDSQLEALSRYWEEETKRPTPSFARALVRALGRDYIFASTIPAITVLSILSQIVLMNYLIQWLRDTDGETWIGVTYLFFFLLSCFLAYASAHRSLMIMMFIVSKAKNFIAVMVARKLLKVSYDSLSSQNTSAKITNLVGTDLELLELLSMTYLLWVLPLFVIGAIVILWMYMGLAGLTGMAAILLHIAAMIGFGQLVMKIRLSITTITDSRIKMITNLIEGIKLVKLYAWEKPFLSQIFEVRSLEISKFFILSIVTTVIMVLYFGLVGVSTLVAIQVYIEAYGEISVEDAFTCMSLFMIFSTCVVGNATLGIRSLFIFLATCKRITDTLLLKEVTIKDQNDDVRGVKIESASFSWSDPNSTPKENSVAEEEATLIETSQPFILTDVNFIAEPGELIIVTGPVGSGKSTLLAGILEEIFIISGKVSVARSRAYVPDTAWVIPGTIQDNILMGRLFDPTLYSLALQVSDLGNDIENLQQKDATVIGESSLSGGQKARLGLARAVYADAEVYLLDDPLSAVDSTVSARIFRGLRTLAEAGKCIILATHQIQTLPSAHRVVLLYEGRQICCGDYTQISDSYADLLGKSAVPKSQIPFVNREEAIELDATQEAVKVFSDQKAEQALPMSIYARYLSFAYRYPLVFIPIALVLLLSQVISLSIFYWVSEWSSAENQTDSLYTFVFWMIVLGCYVFGTLRYIVIFYSLTRANRNLHNASLEAMVRSDARFFDENPTGLILNRFTKDTAVIDENLLTYSAETIDSVLIGYGAVFMVVYLSPGVLVGVCIYAVFFIAVLKALVPVTNQLRLVEITSRGPMLSAINSIVNGTLTIRCLRVEQKFIDIINEVTRTNLKALLSFYSILRLIEFNAGVGSFIIVAVNGICVVLLKNIISTEVAAATLALTVSLNSILCYCGKLISETDNYMISPQRLYDLSQLAPEPTNEEPITVQHGTISFQNVYAKYAPNLPYVLNDLSLEIPAQAKVGVVGRTGAGKSSLLQVLFRLITPTSGSIYIDGQDYLQVGLAELRSSLSVVPQSPLIFRGTAIENVDPFAFYTREEVEMVFAKVNLLQFFNQQPEGIDSILSPDHVSLSTGQKQLLCLARAIIKQSKIVVMDEATANVDNQTDQLIQNMTRTFFVDSTLLVIAHRLRTIIDSDLVVVMECGRCIEFGSPEDLASQPDSAFSAYIDHTGIEEAAHLRQIIHGKLNNH